MQGKKTDVKKTKDKETVDKQIAKRKFFIHKDKIIKVQTEDEKYYIGFDILTEQSFLVKKSINSIELPEVVIKLIGSEEWRFRLANALCDRSDAKIIANILNVSERIVYRHFNKYNMLSDEKALMNSVHNKHKK